MLLDIKITNKETVRLEIRNLIHDFLIVLIQGLAFRFLNFCLLNC